MVLRLSFLSDKYSELSSYEKGIQKLLENSDGFEWIIANYLIETYNKFKSTVFPTTQIAKVLMNKLNKKKSQFAIIHKIVRELMMKYEKEEICTKIEIKRNMESKRTKTIYKFSEEGFKVLKSKIIGFNIKNIEGKISNEFEPATRPREDYIMDYVRNVLDELEGLYDENNDENDEDMDDQE